jgi:DNA invertase Pin-like site-specific DNA recombinase
VTAFIYVRKSIMVDGESTFSPQVQEDRCRALASAHGDTDNIVVLSDLNVSGAKVEERHEYVRLVAAIESGEASAVYAYDLSRLHRNVPEALRFFELADAARVPVRLVGDSVDTSTATGRMVLTILAAVNAMISQQTSEKIKASLKAKRATGWAPGGHAYGTRDGEDVQAVIDAYRSTESLFKAARILNMDGVPTRNATVLKDGVLTRNPKAKGWSPTSVKSVITRNAPDLLKDPINMGAERSRGGIRKHRFARLLRCSLDGSLLTGSVDRGVVRYVCHGAYTTPHGRTQIKEHILLDAIAAETDRALPAIRRLQVGSKADEAALATIDAERARLNVIWQKGRIGEEAYDAAMSDLDVRERALSARRSVTRIGVPPDVRTGDASKVNAYLRRLFSVVVVDMATPGKTGTAVPVAIEATWRDATLRGDDV